MAGEVFCFTDKINPRLTRGTAGNLNTGKTDVFAYPSAERLRQSFFGSKSRGQINSRLLTLSENLHLVICQYSSDKSITVAT